MADNITNGDTGSSDPTPKVHGPKPPKTDRHSLWGSPSISLFGYLSFVTQRISSELTKIPHRELRDRGRVGFKEVHIHCAPVVETDGPDGKRLTYNFCVEGLFMATPITRFLQEEDSDRGSS